MVDYIELFLHQMLQVKQFPDVFQHQYGVSGFGGLRVSVLAFITQVRGFKPS